VAGRGKRLLKNWTTHYTKNLAYNNPVWPLCNSIVLFALHLDWIYMTWCYEYCTMICFLKFTPLKICQDCHQPSVNDQEISDPRCIWYCARCKRNMKKQVKQHVLKAQVASGNACGAVFFLDSGIKLNCFLDVDYTPKKVVCVFPPWTCILFLFSLNSDQLYASVNHVLPNMLLYPSWNCFFAKRSVSRRKPDQPTSREVTS